MKRSVEHESFHGEEAVTLRFGRYLATVLPECGGNLIRFDDVERGLHFLHTPEESQMDHFKTGNPFVYGIPVLFPPNRYEDGKFTLNNRKYEFPVNEESTHNHLHGFLYNVPWSVEDTGCTDERAYVSLSLKVNKHHSVYRYFPHEFKITICYALSENGLAQDVRVENTGVDPMPCMLAFHTTVRVPFADDSNLNDYQFTATIGDRWELTDRMLPTGRHQLLTPEERQMQSSGVSPFFEMMDNHYSALPQNGKNFMSLTDTRLGIRFIYDVGMKYKYWMIFNNFGKGEFFCQEPQTSLVNAPNTGLSVEETGIVMLTSGAAWSETSRFYVEDLK
ncbi:aldose 1-epimerase [Alicyclobacillus ferrooxydans]|nr:aldose 1-epimerase [Alicyclobacillus ferrooxydans]